MKRFSLVFFLLLQSSAFAGLSPKDFFCAQVGGKKPPLMISSTGDLCGGKAPSTMSLCSYSEVACIFVSLEKREEFRRKSADERARIILGSSEKVMSRVACKPRGAGCPSLDECKNSVDLILGAAKVVEGGGPNPIKGATGEKTDSGEGK